MQVAASLVNTATCARLRPQGCLEASETAALFETIGTDFELSQVPVLAWDAAKPDVNI